MSDAQQITTNLLRSALAPPRSVMRCGGYGDQFV